MDVTSPVQLHKCLSKPQARTPDGFCGGIAGPVRLALPSTIPTAVRVGRRHACATSSSPTITLPRSRVIVVIVPAASVAAIASATASAISTVVVARSCLRLVISIPLDDWTISKPGLNLIGFRLVMSQICHAIYASSRLQLGPCCGNIVDSQILNIYWSRWRVRSPPETTKDAVTPPFNTVIDLISDENQSSDGAHACKHCLEDRPDIHCRIDVWYELLSDRTALQRNSRQRSLCDQCKGLTE